MEGLKVATTTLTKMYGNIPNSLKSMEINDKSMFSIIVYVMIITKAWDLYLCFRQRRVYKTKTELPNELFGIMKKDTYEKARLYALDKSNFNMVQEIFSVAFHLCFLYYYGHLFLWDYSKQILQHFGYDPPHHEILTSVVFYALSNCIGVITKVPFDVYYTFVLEEKHNFNKQTAWFFVKDYIKSHIFHQVLTAIVVASITYIVMIGGEYFFVYLWLFTILFSVFFLTIYPDFVAPLFDSYTPLEDGELRTEIEQLAESLEFPLKKLYVVDGSKRSAHSNAYFYGFYKNKRIVLFDTLLEKKNVDGGGCENKEVLAVLAHELGHWKLNHVLKNFIAVQANLFAVFFLFSTLFKFKPLYGAFGFQDSMPIVIGFTVLIVYILPPYFSILSYFMAIMSKRFEFQADQFAKELGRCYSLKSALIKLNTHNLSFPVYDPLFSAWHHSHPPLLERLQALDEDVKKRE